MATPSPPAPATGGRCGLSLAEAIVALVESLTIRKLSPATMKAYQADLAAVTRLLPAHDGPWMVDELVGPVLRTAFAAFAADHAPASVARARSTWTALFDLLVADDQLDGSPMAAVPRRRQPPRAPKPLLGWDKDTVERLVTSVLGGERPGRTVWPELDRVIVALLLGTGLRSAELLGLASGRTRPHPATPSSGSSAEAPSPGPSPSPYRSPS